MHKDSDILSQLLSSTPIGTAFPIIQAPTITTIDVFPTTAPHLGLLLAIKERDLTKLTPSSSVAAVQIQGKSLEDWVQFHITQSLGGILSWCGSLNRPPDVIIKSGVGVEVKQLGLELQDLQFNSSLPKRNITSFDPMLSLECRACELQPWKKEMFYAIGHVAKKQIHTLCIIDGALIANTYKVYQKMLSAIKTALANTDNTHLVSLKTNELGKFRSRDSLGNLIIRNRSMNQLEHPLRLYSDYLPINFKLLKGIFLCSKVRYDAIPESQRQHIETCGKRYDLELPSSTEPNLLVKSIAICQTESDYLKMPLPLKTPEIYKPVRYEQLELF